MTDTIQLYGRVFIQGEIYAQTGLHIGGTNNIFSIGGIDNPVILNPLTRQPYIPGSSLKGKMRSLTEKYLGKNLIFIKHAGVDHIHVCTSQSNYESCPICNIYGISPTQEDREGDKNAKIRNMPTRLVVRDVHLTTDSVNKLKNAQTDLPFTEFKAEVSIDRITSQANLRSIQRVPAGAVFGPMELIYNIYQQSDFEWLETLVDGMVLLEDDYLGGYGSRGSGKIQFRNLQIFLKKGSQIVLSHPFAEISELLSHRQVWMDDILSNLG